MQAFRNIVKGWFGKFILAIVCLLFVLLGSEALLSLTTKQPPMVIVEGEEISKEAVLARVEQQKQFILQQYRGQIQPDLIDEELLKTSVVEGMIKRVLMQKFVDDNSMGIPQAYVNKEILANPDFQENGEFSQELFNRLVKRVGLTPSGYIAEIKFTNIIRQLESVVRLTAFSTPSELSQVKALENQERTFRYARISHKGFEDEVNITSEDIKAYYDQHQDNYMAPEAVKVEYVLFSQSDVAKEMSVDEEQLQEAYTQYVEQIKSEEKRESAHILIEVNEDRSEDSAKSLAESLLKRLQGGEEFSALAKEYSDDIGSKDQGGELGASKRGEFLPEFEEVLFALKEGDTSEVIQTEYGFHIIKLMKIQPLDIKAFDDKKDELKKELQQSLAVEAFLNYETEVGELAFEHEDLSVFEENYDKEIQRTDWITRRTGSGIFQTPNQIKALFATEVIEDGRNSVWISLGEDQGAIARLVTHRPRAVRPINEVKEQIEKLLLTQEAAKLAAKKGQKLIAKLKSMEDFEAVSQEFNVEWAEPVTVDRRSTKAPYKVISKAFSMPKPKDANPVVAGTKDASDFLVISLDGISVSKGADELIESSKDDEKIDSAATLAEENEGSSENALAEAVTEEVEDKDQARVKAISDQYGNREFSSLLDWLESVADITKSVSDS